MDGRGIVVAHQDKDRIMKFDANREQSYAAMWKQLSVGESGFELYTRYDGSPAYVFYPDFRNSRMVLRHHNPRAGNESYGHRPSLKRWRSSLSWSCCPLGHFHFIGNFISWPVKAVQRIVERAKKGGLTIVRDDFAITFRDEFAVVAEEVAKSHKVISLISATASMAESTDGSCANSGCVHGGEVAAVMENVATSTQEVSGTSEILRKMIERFRVD